MILDFTMRKEKLLEKIIRKWLYFFDMQYESKRLQIAHFFVMVFCFIAIITTLYVLTHYWSIPN